MLDIAGCRNNTQERVPIDARIKHFALQCKNKSFGDIRQKNLGDDGKKLKIVSDWAAAAPKGMRSAKTRMPLRGGICWVSQAQPAYDFVVG
jgi:hypothetical protein